MRAAFGFLTVLGGAKRPDASTFHWFPVVGIVVGGVVGGVWWAAGEVWPPLVAAVVVVVADLVLTGMLHVDGLADTADGLLVHDADRDRRLAIMRAPDVGAYGAATVAVVLLARVAGLSALEPEPLLIVGLWTTSRSVIALVPTIVPYPPEEGLASGFLGGAPRLGPAIGVVAGVAFCVVAIGGPGAAAIIGLVAAVGAVVAAARRRLGGFTGDVLGGRRGGDGRPAGRRGPMVTVATVGGAAVGLLVDRAVGELVPEPHPVALYGQAMSSVEDRLWADQRSRGIGFATLGAAVGLGAGLAVRSTALAVSVAAAGRLLRDTAMAVHGRLAADDLDGARAALPALVGRDPSALDPFGVAAAVVESVAENTVDAVVAPALWGAAFGAPGALAHRAVNTLDAMVGHHTERYEHFGWASARADDAMNWLPARATAGLVVAARPRAASAVVRAVRDDAGAHPSPNAGVAEAAFAGALGIELGGPLRYGRRIEDRPRLGQGPRPGPADIRRAVALESHVEAVLAGVLATAAALAWRRR